jgi:ribosomal protein L7/L12
MLIRIDRADLLAILPHLPALGAMGDDMPAACRLIAASQRKASTDAPTYPSTAWLVPRSYAHDTRNGGKIDDIKALRRLTNLGLKEAKDAVESPNPIRLFEIADADAASEMVTRVRHATSEGGVIRVVIARTQHAALSA